LGVLSGGSLGVIVVHLGVVLMTLNCKPAVPDSNPAIFSAYIMDCQSLDGLSSSRMVLQCKISSEGRQKRILTKKASGPPKN
jgi:hypothetical protein